MHQYIKALSLLNELTLRRQASQGFENIMHLNVVTMEFFCSLNIYIFDSFRNHLKFYS